MEVLYGILKDNLKPTNEIIQTVAKNLEKLANSSHEVAQVVEDTEEVIKTSKFNLVTNLTSQEKQGSWPSGDSILSHHCGLVSH